MYRVMIVDDEQLIRITLKNMIDWEAQDCSLIAMAKDGDEAWRIYQEARPEIVITDLKMPKMDGIELTKAIRSDNANTQVVILSNHSDFELVKEAMKAGACDYILKITLEEEELIEVLRQTKQKCIVESNTTNARYENILEKLQHHLVLSKNEHEIKEEEVHDLLKSPLFDVYRKSFQVAYFRVDNINLHYQSKDGTREAIKGNLRDIMQETIPNYIPFQLLFISNHSGIIIFQSEEKLRILNTSNTIMRNISQYLDLQISMTLSEVYKDLGQFLTIYERLLERHQMRFYVGEGVLIQEEDLVTFNRLEMETITFHTQILDIVSTRDFVRMSEVCDDFMMYMKEEFIHPQDVLNYVIFILNNIEGNELAKGVKTGFDFSEVIRIVQQCETIDTLNEIMEVSFKQIEEWLLAKTSNRYRKDIADVIDYVEHNYTMKISLKMISEKFGINESYLSRTFKNETGKNLIYYINERKMHKAKELLCDPMVMVKEAAFAVGIEDQFYFNKVFKKFYDISPSDFRKRMSTREQGKEDERNA